MTRQRIMDNVYLTYIPSEKFKTSFLSAQMVVPMTRESAPLNALLVNVLSRPHFVAYSVPEDRVSSVWLMKHLFRPLLACWTVRDQRTLDDARKEGYLYPIFELFTPEK